jgi:hypothetical protein
MESCAKLKTKKEACAATELHVSTEGGGSWRAGINVPRIAALGFCANVTLKKSATTPADSRCRSARSSRGPLEAVV